MSKSKEGQPAAEESSKNEDLAYLIKKIFEGSDDSTEYLEEAKKLKGFLADIGKYSSLKIKDDMEEKLIEEVIEHKKYLKNEEKLDIRIGQYQSPEGGIPWETVAHSAAQRGNLALLVVLDKCGDDIDMKDMEYKRPIHRAIKYNQPDVFHYLLNHPKVQLNRPGKLRDYATNVGLVPVVSLGIPHVAFHSAVNAIGTAARFVASPLTGASSEEIMEGSKSMHKETTEDFLRYSQRLTRTDVGLEYYAKKHQRLDFLEQIQRKKSPLNTGAAEDREPSMAKDANSTTSQLAKAIPISMEEVGKSNNLVRAESRYATRSELVKAEEEPQNAIPITLEEGSNSDLVYAESRSIEDDPRAAEDVKFLKVQESSESSKFLIESKTIVNSTRPLPAKAVPTSKKEAQAHISATGILAVAATPKTTTEKERENALEEQFETIPEVPTHEPHLEPVSAVPTLEEELEKIPEVPNNKPNLKPVSVVPNTTPEPEEVKKLDPSRKLGPDFHVNK